MATSTAAPMDALGFPEALAAQLARRSKGDFESAIAGRPVSEDQLTDARAITVIFLSRRGRKALETSCEKSAVERLAGSDAFKNLFREGMLLVEEAAAYLDGDGRDEPKALLVAGARAQTAVDWLIDKAGPLE